MSGDKSAWPVYLSIGNIDKGTRRKPSSHATVLLGYLPVAKLECFSEKRRSLEGYRLYHLCMRKILEPLFAAGKDGIDMVCADGFIRRIYPLLAAYIADHPEQCLISACRENFCPKCPVDPGKRGEPTHARLKHPPHIISILERTATGEKVPEFDTLGLRPVIPFWKDLPHCNIFAALTPDILHQLHKGLFKDHLVKWVTKAIAGGKEEIDYRFKTMTRHSNLRQFKNGISMVTQWTGNEYKNMERVFLGVIAGAGEPDVTLAVRAVLNFIYYAHFETHTDRTLDALHAAWLDYHRYKLVFQRAGIRTHFNFPKGHSTEHYEPSIRALGTADGYNTEHPERLHIDFAKVAYSASNKQITYLKQMTNWLNRQEAIIRFTSFLEWTAPLRRETASDDKPGGSDILQDGHGEDEEHEDEDEDEDEDEKDGEDGTHGQTARSLGKPSGILHAPKQGPADPYAKGYRVAKVPAFPSLPIRDFIRDFALHDRDFFRCLTTFAAALPTPLLGITPLPLPTLHFQTRISVYKQLKLCLPLLRQVSAHPMLDIVHASPAHPGRYGTTVPANLSTILVRERGSHSETSQATPHGLPTPLQGQSARIYYRFASC